MIAKRIDRTDPAHDNYRALALYVGGFTEQKPDEKVLHTWTVGCESETYQEAMIEIEATQHLNTRTQKVKTYHLIVSFRPEDESKLTSEALDDIEHRFAVALGYENHQRCCGIHKNTNNLHMHIAYNMINPETFNRHEKLRDFNHLARVRRELELEYGLAIDNNHLEAKITEPKRTNTKAQTIEAHTGQQSFSGYVASYQQELMELISVAQTWQELHQKIADYGLGIKISNTGFAFYNLKGKEHVKASELHRRASKQYLEKRLGKFEPAQGKYPIINSYKKLPLHTSPKRDALYQEYLSVMAKKDMHQKNLDVVTTAVKTAKDAVKEKWAKQRKALKENNNLSSKDRWSLMQRSYLLQKEEMADLPEVLNKKHQIQKFRAEYPFSSWTGFLKQRALAGNETALGILRSKKIALGEQPESPKKLDLSDQKAFVLKSAMTTKDKKRFMATLKLQEKLDQELTTNITPSGVFVISLPSGGTVRDDGKQIYFSGFDAKAKDAAKVYAKIKFGKRCYIEGNVVVVSQSGVKAVDMKKHEVSRYK